ncbi:MAG TPA: hypothetical protein VD902_02965 [Symbiobacteriaceae bacterium]|nr:hypothetical protein [Symbiobacteriaceae bacterium]
MTRFDLADLLTATGTAMAVSNQRLAATGAPALLREFQVELNFDAGFEVPPGACTLALTDVRRPNPQAVAMMAGQKGQVKVSATYIAAPAVRTVAPGGEVVCP